MTSPQRTAPRYLRVFGDFNMRGGIAITPLALRTAALSADEEHHYLSLVTHYDSLTRTNTPSPETP